MNHSRNPQKSGKYAVRITSIKGFTQKIPQNIPKFPEIPENPEIPRKFQHNPRNSKN